jgi:hypothetical protein
MVALFPLKRQLTFTSRSFLNHRFGSKGEKQEDGRSLVMRNFIMYSLRQILRIKVIKSRGSGLAGNVARPE